VTFIIMQATGRRYLMGKVVSHMTVSLDGFIADPHDGVAELFGWYEAGTVTVPSAGERWSFTVDERSAQLLRRYRRPTAPWCAGGACSTTPTAGTGTRSAPRWSW
jgi:hypothetical protein